MFTYLIVLGTGAITFVIEKKLAGKRDDRAVFMVIEYLMYVGIDLVSTYLLLSPTGRITMVQSEAGTSEIVYGSSAIIVSIVLSVIWGLVFAFLNKNVKFDVRIDKK